MGTLSEYCAFLNDEAYAGIAAEQLLAVGPGDRRALLARHPDWLRLGVLDELLAAARKTFDQDAGAARDLTEFVIDIVDGVSVPAEYDFLIAQLRGTAWKEHGNALYMLKRLDDALPAAHRAVNCFSAHPVLVVEHTRAIVLVALILRGQREYAQATALLEHCLRVFGEHGQTRGYLHAIQTQAMIALDQNNLPRARELYLCAFAEADRLDDDHERARIQNNLGRIALRLRDLDSATEYLGRAFLGFSRNQMFGELQRAIMNAALVAKEQGKLSEALTALHGTYARFLARGMVAEAAAVNLEIADVVLALTGDLAYAQAVCTKLTVTLGRYDVPGNVEAAIRYADTAAAQVTTVAGLRAVLSSVVAFLREVLVSPLAVFTIPTLPEESR
jgi:tetratricopeptide (TPR) repeat protein